MNGEQYEPCPPAHSFIPAEWDAIRQTVNCPTCDGDQCSADSVWINDAQDEQGGYESEPCPDCTDGKIPMARLIAVGAAVFTWRDDNALPI